MLPLASIAIATIFLGIAASTSLKGTSAEIEERSEILENSGVVHCGHVKREKRQTKASPRQEEALNPLRRESSADELAAAVGLQNVGYHDTGNYVSEHPRQAIGWRDAVPGTPGMDYPNLDEVPVTSFTCMDKEPGGYYADVETGCQVFHVCNTGGVKSSFLCPSGSIFNQKHYVCDWWYGFNCQEAEDFYIKKPEANFADLDKDSIDFAIDNPDDTTQISESFDSSPEKYFQDSRIQNHVNPPNDSSLTSNRRRIIDHSPREESRQIDESYTTNVRNYPTDSRSHKDIDNYRSEDHMPRGFSRNDEKPFKRRTFHLEMTSHDSTNDLASYVNYAYFQAGLNDNRNHNDGYDDDIQNSSDTIILGDDSKSDRHFGGKLIHEKKSSTGYSETDDQHRTQSFKSIDDYEREPRRRSHV